MKMENLEMIGRIADKIPLSQSGPSIADSEQSQRKPL